MKFRTWLGASLVLTITFAGTLAWFFYWEQLKSESMRSLQTRLNEIELQRFQDDKGQQVQAAARTAAKLYDELILQLRKRVDALADQDLLRRPHQRPPDRARKKTAFLQLMTQAMTAQPDILGAVITDERGQRLAITPQLSKSEPALDIASDFNYAAKQRSTKVRLEPKNKKDNEEIHARITAPCLGEAGEFLGVLVVVIRIPSSDWDKIVSASGMMVMAGTLQGRRFTPSPRKGFPKNLGMLLNKKPEEMETLMKSTGFGYFRAQWEGTNYILGSALTQDAKTVVFTLMEFSGLEKVVGPRAAQSSWFEDPVVLGGLGLVLFLGLILNTLVGGSASGIVKKLNHQLAGMLQTGSRLTAVKSPARGEWQKLADYITLIIEKSQALSSVAMPAAADLEEGTDALMGQYAEQVEHLRMEIEDLRQSSISLQTQNQELKQEVNQLNQQNQMLQESIDNQPPAVPAPLPAPAPAVDTSKQDNKDASALRIEAITNMSEDLKATLTVIKNYISSILASEEGKITDKQQEFLGVVINKSARLERQINDLLDLSHMESEAAELYLTSADLVSMLQDVVLNMQPQADIKQIKLNAEIQTPLPEVMINSDRLGQAFINLVQHAIKITRFGSEVKIIAIETLSDIVIKIRDGGIPLNSEQASCVFTTFSGTDTKCGSDLVGTGLRFPIIKRIVDVHNGTIAIRGLPDQGNEVVVTLPKTPESAAGSAARRSTQVFTQTMLGQAQPESPKSPQAEAPAATVPAAETDAGFDLSSFMGKMEEEEEPAANPQLAGASDNLDELLRDIESIDGNMDKS